MTSPFKKNIQHHSIPILRSSLEERGFKLSISNRETAQGFKRYFKVKWKKDISREEMLLNAPRLLPKFNLTDIRNIIREYFPYAHMTSGGILEATFAEW